ncbi:hypothetical protein G6F24_015513 [Rhizopus arrhizus]|nr:hypothetical protein G6F24_015513 [Rhizopus arrhizus]
MRQQHRHHRAPQIGHGGAGGLQAVEIAAGGNAFVAHDGCARDQRLEAGVQRVGMEQRQAGVEPARLGGQHTPWASPEVPEVYRMADMSPGRMSAAGGRGVSGGGGGALAGAGSPLTGEASSSSQIARKRNASAGRPARCVSCRSGSPA